MNAQSISFPVRVAALIGIELIAWLITQLILAQYPWTSPMAETLRTLLRVQTVTLDWYLFRGILQAPARRPDPLAAPVLAVAMLLMLSVPLLVPHAALPAPAAAFFALTSVIVGLKEEVLFRGIVQPLLQGRIGAMPAVALTSTLFTLWHIGAVPLTPVAAAEIFLSSVALGLVYLHTGNLLTVVLLHAAYDALYMLAPSAVQGEPQPWALLPLAAAAAALLHARSRHMAARPIASGSSEAAGIEAPHREDMRRAEEGFRNATVAAAPGFASRGRRKWTGPVHTHHPTS